MSKHGSKPGKGYGNMGRTDQHNKVTQFDSNHQTHQRVSDDRHYQDHWSRRNTNPNTMKWGRFMDY